MFYDLLSEAIADFMKYGFDSQYRLETWTNRLNAAARAMLIPQNVLEKSLRDALIRVFRRSTTPAALLRRHHGISLFTIEQIKPKLRLELDRRILAAANLIRLNREASIARTLGRFQGWATSIPIGGSGLDTRSEVATSVRRGVAGLPFEERRVIIDQGHKLTSAVNDIVATDGGAIAGIWRHVMEGGGYQARPQHEARNGHIFVIRSNWAIARGLMKLDGREYTDQIEQPAELPFCRCTYQYLYNLRDLPRSMLTAKGASELMRVRAAITKMTKLEDAA